MPRFSVTLRKSPVAVVFPPHGLAVIESRHGEGFFMDWRKDEYQKLLLVVEGRGKLQLEKRSLELEAPGLVVVPEGVQHKIVDDITQPLWLYGLCLRYPVFPSDNLIGKVFNEPRIIRDPEVTSRAVTTLRRLLFESRSPSHESVDYQLCLAVQLLVDIARHGDREVRGIDSNARVRAYAAELRQTFWMADNVDQVAARLGLSRRRFTQLFRQETGFSWLDYVSGLRMAHAARLLRESSLPIKSVVFECGFSDIAHFYRLFKRIHRMTPQVWRSGKGER